MPERSPGSGNRFRLLRASRWLLSLYTGVSFGLLLWVATLLVGGAGPTAATTGVLAGVLFAVVTGPLLARVDGRDRPAADAVPDRSHRAVLRAAAGGPVPRDPQLRAAALALATNQLAGAVRLRWPVTGLLGLLTVLESAAALAYTPWLWVGAAVFLVILVFQLRQPARLRRRISELRTDRS